MTATAIVVTHNSAGQLGEALEALCSSGVAVRVVDNASTDQTVELLDSDYSGLWLAANPVNVGFARAVNQALADVTADVVLLVNPDCVVQPSTIHGLVDHLRTHSWVGAAGPRLVGSDGEPAISAHPFETLWSVLASRFGGGLLPAGIRRWLGGRARRRSYEACLGDPPITTPVPVDWLSGACLAVRGELLRELGGLDERYFMYYEDEELCLQASHRGYQVELLPHLWAEHTGGASSEPGATWPQLYRSMLIFFGSHRRSSYQLVRLVVLLRALLGIGLAQLRRLFRRPGAWTRLHSWREVRSLAWTARQPPDTLLDGAQTPAPAPEWWDAFVSTAPSAAPAEPLVPQPVAPPPPVPAAVTFLHAGDPAPAVAARRQLREVPCEY
jgi:N-acetylglucosaminyl-diphospho-decaprenol L-rhamnosyltransferase